MLPLSVHAREARQRAAVQGEQVPRGPQAALPQEQHYALLISLALEP